MVHVAIEAVHLRSIAEVLRHFAPGRPVFLFGSRVTGLAQQDSDLDIAVGGAATLSPEERRCIRFALEDLELPYEIDLVDLTETTPIFRKRIGMEWISLEQAVASSTKVAA